MFYVKKQTLCNVLLMFSRKKEMFATGNWLEIPVGSPTTWFSKKSVTKWNFPFSFTHHKNTFNKIQVVIFGKKQTK